MIFFSTVPRGKSYIQTKDLFLGFIHLLRFRKSAVSVKKFEENFRELYGSKRCLTFSSCRSALYYLLKCLRVEKGSDVLLTPITIPDVVNAVRVAGYNPVFVDLDPDTQNIDMDDLKNKISERTRIVLITHLSGIAPEMDALMSYLRKRNIFVIEDISQNYLSKSSGKLVGTYGDATVGSMCTTKTICSLVGGILLINDTNVLTLFKNYTRPPQLRYSNGIFLKLLFKELQIEIFTKRFVFTVFTYPCFFLMRFLFAGSFEKRSNLNFRAKRRTAAESLPFYENIPVLRKDMPKDIAFSLNEFQGFLAQKTLSRADRGQKKRRRLASVLLSELETSAKEALPKSLLELEENGYWHFPIYVEDKSKFSSFLFSLGIDVIGTTLQLCSQLEEFGEYRVQTKGAQYIVNHNMFLPIHDDYTPHDMKRLATTVNEYFRNEGTKKNAS